MKTSTVPEAQLMMAQSISVGNMLAFLFAFALALTWPRSTPAQQYSLSRYVVAGGGGQASGGGWTLNATIGQAAAGTTSGGGLTLTAGFWALEAQTPPRLMIALVGNSVVLSWPVTALGFALQQTPALAPATWTPVSATPTNNGIVNSVTLSITPTNTFYRLAR